MAWKDPEDLKNTYSCFGYNVYTSGMYRLKMYYLHCIMCIHLNANLLGWNDFGRLQ